MSAGDCKSSLCGQGGDRRQRARDDALILKRAVGDDCGRQRGRRAVFDEPLGDMLHTGKTHVEHGGGTGLASVASRAAPSASPCPATNVTLCA